MQKIWLWLVLAVLGASLVGCESGSVRGGSTTCSSSGSSGSCRGTFTTLSGTYAKEIEMQRTRAQSITVNVHVSVDKGTVRVYVVAPDETETGATATPDQPATFSGQARTSRSGQAGASTERFSVYFKAVEETASGISYTIDYTVP